MSQVAVFVIDRHDIALYPDAEGAAREVEGHDAQTLNFFGVDGTVYTATVEGPEWGPDTLHPTPESRLAGIYPPALQDLLTLQALSPLDLVLALATGIVGWLTARLQRRPRVLPLPRYDPAPRVHLPGDEADG